MLISAVAAQSQWTSIGPAGGWADCVLFHAGSPDTVYLGGDTYGSFYRSTNGGQAWTRIAGFGPHNAWSMTLLPGAPNTVFVANIMDDSIGIMKSTDGGRTWTTILKWPDMSSVAVNPLHPDTMYAGAGLWPPYQEQNHGEGVWISTDQGISWSRIGLDTLRVQSVAVNPVAPNLIYAAVYIGGTGGVYMSTNSGQTWTRSGLAARNVWKVAVSPDSTNIVYAATFDSIYISRNYGWLDWTPLPVPTGDPQGYFFAFAIAPAANRVLYAGSLTRGIFRSTDRGQTWTAVNNNLPSTRVWGLTVHPADPNTVFSCHMGIGVWRTTNAGASWQDANDGFACQYGFALAADPSGGLYAGFYNESGNSFASVKRYDGTSWQDRGINDLFVRSVAVDPGNPSILYASTIHQDQQIFPGGDVYKTTNAGADWSLIQNGLSDSLYFEAIAVDPGDPSLVYGGSSMYYGYLGGRGIYKSTNAGGLWMFSGLDTMTVIAIAIRPDSTNVIYAGTLGGLYRSTNAGATWTELVLAGVPVLAIALKPSAPQTIFVGSYTAGVLRSTDAGATWLQVGLAGRSVTGIAIDPQFPDTLYAGGSESILPGWGVFRSTNNGNTWDDFGQGLINYEVSRLAIVPGTRTIYCATLGYGLYKRSLPQVGTEEKQIMSRDGRTVHLRAHPNPFRKRTQIEYPSPDAGGKPETTLGIYDALGRSVKSIHLNASPMPHAGSMIWPGDDDSGRLLPPGVYFLRLEAGNHSITIKMVKLD